MTRPLGTVFGRSRDRQHLRLTCLDCEKGDFLLALDMGNEQFKAEWKKFSEAHRPCRNGQDEPDYARQEEA
jgi:hypothetical protein